MKWLKAIFSTPEVIGKAADAAINAGDALVFTKEEKSAAFLEFVRSSMPMNLARRVIAMAVAAVWFLSAVTLLLLTVAAGLTESLVIAKTAESVFNMMKDVINWPFMTVMGFYFAKNIIGSMKK